MTPIPVLDSYLGALVTSPFTLDALVHRVGLDADLLGAWLTTLALPADPELFSARLSSLPDCVLRDLAAAHALAVLTVSGDARMAFSRWREAVTASYLAEALALAAARDGENVNVGALRWQTLLGRAGVALPGDADVTEMLAYRGAQLDLFEDADLAVRVFAVVERFAARDLTEAQTAAGRLLDLSTSAFQSALRRAEQAAEQACAHLPVDVALTDSRPDRIWLRLRVLGAGASLQQEGRDHGELAHAHARVSRLLFRVHPVLLMRDDARDRWVPLDGSGPSIGTRSTSSAIARSPQRGERVEFFDGASTGIADRQWLRRLGSDGAMALPLGERDGSGLPVGVMLFPLGEDLDPETDFALDLYAEELGFRYRAAAAGGDAQTDALSTFRQLSESRLRELVHEANNPLSIVQNYLHILELTLTDRPQALEQLRVIGSELRRVASLLGDIRQVPQVLAVDEPEHDPVVEVRRALFDAGALLARLGELHRGLAAERGARLITQVPPMPLMIASDADRVAQIATNLLKNALEASREHEVRLELQAGAFRDGREGVYLTVADTGPGLPRPVLEQLGERQVSTKGGDHAGVGLQVVHRLVAELGGSIDVRSSPGQGASFGIFLPLDR